jgi:hypothetical protein
MIIAIRTMVVASAEMTGLPEDIVRSDKGKLQTRKSCSVCAFQKRLFPENPSQVALRGVGVRKGMKPSARYSPNCVSILVGKTWDRAKKWQATSSHQWRCHAISCPCSFQNDSFQLSAKP